MDLSAELTRDEESLEVDGVSSQTRADRARNLLPSEEVEDDLSRAIHSTLAERRRSDRIRDALLLIVCSSLIVAELVIILHFAPKQLEVHWPTSVVDMGLESLWRRKDRAVVPPHLRKVRYTSSVVSPAEDAWMDEAARRRIKGQEKP